MGLIIDQPVSIELLFEELDTHDSLFVRAAEFGWIQAKLEDKISFYRWVLTSQQSTLGDLINHVGNIPNLVTWGETKYVGPYPVKRTLLTVKF